MHNFVNIQGCGINLTEFLKIAPTDTLLRLFAMHVPFNKMTAEYI